MRRRALRLLVLLAMPAIGVATWRSTDHKPFKHPDWRPIMQRTAQTPPIFELDLDKPPRERWHGVMKLFNTSEIYPMNDFPKGFAETWRWIFKFTNESATTMQYQRISQLHYDKMSEALERHWPEMAEELKSIHDEFVSIGADFVTYQYLVAWAYSHELAHCDWMNTGYSASIFEANWLMTTMPATSSLEGKACTAMITQDHNHGVHHVALMDQSPKEIRDVVLHIKFMRGKKLIFEGADWYWFAGGVTRAMKPGFISLQENWRTPLVGEPIPPYVVWDLMMGGVMPQTWVFRLTLADESLTRDFNHTVHHLASMPLAAPYYVAAGGVEKNQGVVFARTSPLGQRGLLTDETDTVAPTYSSGFDYLDVDNDVWYLVQANTDRWMDYNDSTRNISRTAFAEATLDEAGRSRGASDLGLFGIAQAYPVMNPTTVFVAVMNAKDGVFQPFVQSEPMIPVDQYKYATFGLRSQVGIINHYANETHRLLNQQYLEAAWCSNGFGAQVVDQFTWFHRWSATDKFFFDLWLNHFQYNPPQDFHFWISVPANLALVGANIVLSFLCLCLCCCFGCGRSKYDSWHKIS